MLTPKIWLRAIEAAPSILAMTLAGLTIAAAVAAAVKRTAPPRALWPRPSWLAPAFTTRAHAMARAVARTRRSDFAPRAAISWLT